MGCLRSTRDADRCLRRRQIVDDYDQMLHQSLTKVFTDRHLTSNQIKHLLRNDNSVIKSILVHQEPLLDALFSNEELEKLSLLWLAVLRRYENSLELLVRSGADVNETFGLAQTGLYEGSTVLHAMVRGYPPSEDERLIRLVTDHGADLEARDYQERTVLQYAVTQDRVELVQMFLDNGANVSFVNIKNHTPFLFILGKKLKNPMVQLIIKALALQKFSRRMIDVRDEFLIGMFPELKDYYRNCIEYIYSIKMTRFAKGCSFSQLLTQCPCNIAALMRDPDFENNFRLYDLNGFSMYAEDILRAFERARNLYNSMLEQENVINEAVYRILPDKVVKKVVQYSCKCCCENIRRRKLALLLHEKIYEGQVELVEKLLEKGADINFVNEHGRTPLLEAARSSEADKLLPLLIKRGADVFAKDRHGGNAFYHLAWASRNLAEQARILIEIGVSPHDIHHNGFQPIHHAVKRENHELVKLLLDQGADVNALGKDNESLLYLAAISRNSTVLKTLLQWGADVNLRTIKGRTALHSACENFKKENIKLLLFAGADVLVEDYEGKTPFALISRVNMENPNIVMPMIKALALKRVCLQPSIQLKDVNIIRNKYPWLWNYYQGCVLHVSRMKFMRFNKSCTFLDLFTKNRCQIAALMRNPGFEASFELYDLRDFSMYAEDILGAFVRARNHYYSRLEQEDVINDAVDYILPDLVVREVIRYIFACCENFKRRVR